MIGYERAKELLKPGLSEEEMQEIVKEIYAFADLVADMLEERDLTNKNT